MSSEAKWVERIGVRGARLRYRYIYWRLSIFVWVVIFALVGAVMRYLRVAGTDASIALVIIIVASVAGGSLIVRAQVVSKRRAVAEILRYCRLPEMAMADRSLFTIAGYEDWIGRVGILARRPNPGIPSS
ncbi:hypothetical protein [Glaciihabitans sp. GrIS 2.15]|uniref:hypothetical protein n=1 Tax=Glaciihabitans sp. GrIS 2.15 TaxID=3071710 RepID=UPI002DF8E9AA|nr:hypothetical protein [Glaciihabitans sp. GrIS 2.15]